MKKKNEIRIFDRVLRHALKQKSLVIFIFILLTLAIVFGQMIPLIKGYMVDYIIVPGTSEFFLYFVLVIVSVLIFEAVCMFGQKQCLNNLGYFMVRELKKDVFRSLMKRDYEFFEIHSHGDILLKLNFAVKDLGEYVARELSDVIFNVLQLLSVFLFMLSLNYILALIAFGSYVIIGLVIFVIGRMLKGRYYDVKKMWYEINGILLEQITGFTFIQTYNRNYKKLRNYEESSSHYPRVRKRFYRPYFALKPITDMLATMFMCSTFVLSLLLFSNEVFTLGIVIAFLGFVTDSISPLSNIATSVEDIVRMGGLSDNIAFLMEDNKGKERKAIIDKKPDIKFVGVSNRHAYKGVVLEGINLEIKYGQSVLIHGAHGNGKSTFARMLLGLYEPFKGKILIGGENIKYIDKKNLHSVVGFAGERPFILTDTIYNNILMTRPEATEEEVMHAIELSGVKNITDKLKGGAATIIGQEQSLSIGEKQLIGLARLILKDPKIIILDEVLLDVDMKTRKRYQKILSELKGDRTIIYISGKKNISLDFDKEILIKKGRIMSVKTNRDPQS